MNKPTEASMADLVKYAHDLADRMISDPVVSDDMKEMACIVRLLAIGLRETEECLAALASRPAGKTVNINYTNK